VRRLNYTFFICLCVVVQSLCGLNTASAQPKSYLLIHDADHVINDLKAIIQDRAGEKKVWESKVLPNIEIFLGGVERSEPILFEVQLDPVKGEQYRPSFPVSASNEGAFLKNIFGLGIKNRPAGKDMYSLRGAYTGFLLYQGNYAHFALNQADLKTVNDPKEIGKPFLDKDIDLAYWMQNDEAHIQDRRDSFTKLRKRMVENLPERASFSKEENDLAKLATQQQLEEVERYFAESEKIDLSWMTEQGANAATGFLHFEALPKTGLSESLHLITKAPSKFISVMPAEKSAVSGRLFFPLDEFRKTQLMAFYKHFRPVIKQRLDKVKKLDAAQIEASKTAVDALIDMLESGTKLDNLDGCIELRMAENNLYHGVFAVQSADPTPLTTLLESIAKVDRKSVLTMNKLKIKDVNFHEFILKQDVPKAIAFLYGKEPRFLIGVKDNMIWVGNGAKVEEDLERMLTESETAPPAITEATQVNILTFKGSLATILTAYDLELTGLGKTDEMRTILVNALKEQDGRVESLLWLLNGKIDGTLKLDSPALRAIGKYIAIAADKSL
jgi:hypothetical protein